MNTNQAYRDRDRGGEREREGGGSGGGGGGREGGGYRPYNNRGGNFRGRGGPGGYKPRRYWDNDEYYKDERDHGGRGRRRRSYSRSRSRSRSYSRSRSRSPSPSRRGRSPPRQKDISQRPPEQSRHVPPEVHEPYVPSIKEPSHGWSDSRMQLPQEYMTQTNGQAHHHSQMHPYGNIETPTAYPPPSHYQGVPPGMAVHNPSMGYGYGHNSLIPPETQYQPHQPVMYPPHGAISQAAVPPPPPALSEVKPTKDDASSEGSKKKKDKRKKKKRHHSSSSSSSSSDESSGSRRRRKSKKENGSSDSSSEEDKKESSQSSGLTLDQKNALLKQREGYQTKLDILEREIAKLQSKEDELIRNRADSQLIDENLKLQAELKGRCKAVLIVLEKIDDVLKVKPSSHTEKVRSSAPKPQEAPVPPPYQPAKASVSSSPSLSLTEGSRKVSYDYFDNGQHWCRLCNVFPETVEQMLSHFHSKEHHDQIQQLGIDEKPWHKRNSGIESKPVPGASKAPFRGMQFFSPVEGWYCRLCNNWMGDPHCAVEHLKSDEHNANYMNFLEEHPDWEHKWISDRERALGVSGKHEPAYPAKKSRFDDSRPSRRDSIDRKPAAAQEDLESGKSIRVQMRNSLKTEERGGGGGSQFTSAPIHHEPPVPKDSGLEEWMTKPKVTVDIIDTQKFAAIVRQKHGAKEKESKEGKHETPEVKPSPTISPVSSHKEKDYRKEKDDRRRTDKVELQISSGSRDLRDKDRGDKYRERDNRRDTRRRSRSRSRSRSRDRRYNRRRSRTRSRSRSRDRSDRDRDRRDRGSDRDRPEFKEAVKKLPMIGKMPLYKRPAINREKPEAEKSKIASAEASPKPVAAPTAGFLAKDVAKNQAENINQLYNENPVNAAYSYEAHSGYEHGASIQHEGYGMQSAAYAQVSSDPPMEESVSKDFPVAAVEMTEEAPPGEELKEGKEGAPAALPDDFQQALDIIYAVPGAKVPQPVPPPAIPGANGVADEHSATEYGDYSANGYASYMGYQPYQQSFDGYAPVGYDELDDGPPGVGDGAARPQGAATEQAESAAEKDPPPPGDDDMEDLRMLGIDVDDTAVVLKH